MTEDEERPEGDTEDAPARKPLSLLAQAGVVVAGLCLSGVFLVLLTAILAYPNLPPIDSVTDYRPKIPLRVFTADGVLIGEFGEERRNVVRFSEVPLVMKQAILAAEDERFYQHSGIDYTGILRAAISNSLHSDRRQGASTITQQVARNFFLSSEKSYIRKFYEALMAFKIESSLTKDQIFELYINQIYLGQRAYGFASAERVYYGKDLKDITAGEAAMLAGMPKAPSRYNPVVNPVRAGERQHYVLGRMLALGFLNQDQFDNAKVEKHVVHTEGVQYTVHAEYASELVRQIAEDMFKEDVYSRGLNVYTTLNSAEQAAAYTAVRTGVLAYERRQRYEGPEAFVDLPTNDADVPQAVEDALLEYTDADDILAAVVLEAGPKLVRVMRPGEDPIEITGDGLKPATSALADKAPPDKKLRRGAIIRITHNPKGAWEITQMPQIQAAFVAGSSQDGAIHAMVGGFDFNKNKFNHVTQAWRQPGSGFKPFVYSAALEKGVTPATIVNDAPIIIDAAETGSQTWEPKNYEGKFEGPMTVRTALQKSKNMVSIRIMQYITPKYVQGYIGRFGFDPDKHPAYLPMALGAGSVTAWQMIGAYSVFANGGYKINPYLIDRITDASGQELARAQPAHAGDEGNRVIDARNAFIMDSLLKGVARYGTAAGASAALKRTDIGGKTGTTNESKDAWFNGYINQGEVAIAWIGFDQPRSLGDRESGGGLALPLWITYMQTALKGVPEKERPVPPGVITVAGEYYYSEFGPAQSVISLGMDEATPASAEPAASPASPPVTPAVPASQTPVGAPADKNSAPAKRDIPEPVPYGTLRN